MPASYCVHHDDRGDDIDDDDVDVDDDDDDVVVDVDDVINGRVAHQRAQC